MPDNWGFVAAAYALTAVVLGLYWRHLVRKEKELQGSGRTAGSAGNVAGTTRAHTERTRQSSISDQATAERSRQPSRPAHPRTDPTSRHPLQ